MSEVPPPPPRRLFDWRLLPLVTVTAIVLWLLIRHLAGVDAFLATVVRARLGLVAMAVGVLAVDLGVAVLRWQLILRAMSYPVSFMRCAHAVVSVWPFALMVPARAGDVLRAAAVCDKVPFLEGAGSVVAEKLLDVQSLCILSIVGTLLHGLYGWTLVPAGVLVAEWGVVILLVRYREAALRRGGLARFANRGTQLLAALHALLRSPRYLAGALLASVVAWLLSCLIMYVLLAATDAGVGFGLTLSLWPIAVFAGLLPVTVAGMGTRDAAFVFALRASSDAPVREESILAATLGFSLVATWLLAVVGLPFAIRFALHRPVQSSARTNHV
jgi:hypothetical protein